MKLVLVEKNRAPYGVKCEFCNKIAKEGQFVLLKTITNVGHVVMHKKCTYDVLDSAPNDIDKSLEAEYTNIKSQYIEGKVFDG